MNKEQKIVNKTRTIWILTRQIIDKKIYERKKNLLFKIIQLFCKDLDPDL